MTSPAVERALTISDLVERPFLRSYLRNVRDWHGYVRFLGLPDRRDNRDVLIDRLFVEPLLTTRHVSPDEDPSSWIDEAESVFDVLRIDKPVILLGDPGTGKSTLLNFLVWLLARPTEATWTEHMGQWLLPVPMVLRELPLRDVTTFRGLLDAFLCHPMSQPLRQGHYLQEFLSDARVFMLLDGIDEISDLTGRENLRAAIVDGFNLYPNCKWLLSSRVVGYDEVRFEEQKSRHSTVPEKITPSIKENLSLEDFSWDLHQDSTEIPKVRQNLDAGGLAVRYIAPFDDKRIEAFSRNWYVQREAAALRAGEDAAHLVRAVLADSAIHRLARIPNLLTMMALIHRIEVTLPDGRALLYQRISEAYLESIDKSRGVPSGAYNLLQKMRWLARIGYEMQRRRASSLQQDTETQEEFDSNESELLVDANTVIFWLKDEMKSLTETSSGISAEEFLDFVGRRSGLFLPRSEGRYAFVHLSFQEYFAAVALEDEVTGVKWARNEKTRLGVTHDSLFEQAGQSAWSETFLFLFELLASKVDWYANLVDALFGEDFSKIEGVKSILRITNLLKLLARLIVNPQCRLSSEKQRSAITAAVQKIMSYKRSSRAHELAPSFALEDMLSVFLEALRGKESDLSEHIVTTISDAARNYDVRSLHFSLSSISDLSPFAGLTGLESLAFCYTKVSDLSPLAGLTGLESLELRDTRVSDCRPLAGLTALKFLHLDRTKISDLGPLAGLVALESLDLIGTQVSDLRPLRGLGALKLLGLEGTRVSDLSPLASLKALESLGLESTNTSDLSSLSGLSTLKRINLNRTKVVDLGPLSSLTALTSLYLQGTGVTNLAPLAGLRALESLDLRDTQVWDMAPLADLTMLEFLDLDGSKVEDCRPLGNLVALAVLDLRGTKVVDLSPLAGLTSLRSLILCDTGVKDLTPLAGLTGLRKLNLEGTQVRNLSPLISLNALMQLDLRQTMVSKAAVEKLKEVVPECNIIM